LLSIAKPVITIIAKKKKKKTHVMRRTESLSNRNRKTFYWKIPFDCQQHATIFQVWKAYEPLISLNLEASIDAFS